MISLVRNVMPAAAGGLVVFGLMAGYDAVFDDPQIRAQTRKIVEAEARQRTEAAINEVTDHAEKARAMRRHCRDVGRVYDFATGKCGEDGP